jgi:hypothetical protein
MNTERRAFTRAHVALAVRYEADGEPARLGRIENISRGGVLLLVGLDDVPEGAQVRITFNDDRGIDHIVVGRIARSSPEGLLGVTFLEVDDTTFDYVERVLAGEEPDDRPR